MKLAAGDLIVWLIIAIVGIAKFLGSISKADPANAAEGTIRKQFAESIEANSVHGSDSLENAKIEIAYFFAETEIVG